MVPSVSGPSSEHEQVLLPRCASHLAEVAHDLQVLHVEVVASVRVHDLRALPGEPVGDVSPQEPCAAEEGGDDPADLRGGRYGWSASRQQRCHGALGILDTTRRQPAARSGQVRRTEERPPAPALTPVLLRAALRCVAS